VDISLAGTGTCKLQLDRFSWNDQSDNSEKCGASGDLGGRRQNCKCRVPLTASRQTASCADLWYTMSMRARVFVCVGRYVCVVRIFKLF
jgi:hypothetical protein